MISARALIEGNDKTMRMVAFGPDEPPRSVQLYGVDPAVVDEAVRRLVDEHGVDHVDLNFGCPVAKVTRQGGGAALPLHQELFRNIVRAAVGAAARRLPVTVKLRMGVDDEHLTYLDAGPHRRGRRRRRSRPARPHGRAVLLRTRPMVGHRRAQGRGHLDAGARQRRHLGSRRRAAR